jgi:hypothetical protein
MYRDVYRRTQRQPPLVEAIFAHFFVEKPSVNTEKFLRPALVPLRLSQSAFDKGFFQSARRPQPEEPAAA